MNIVSPRVNGFGFDGGSMENSTPARGGSHARAACAALSARSADNR